MSSSTSVYEIESPAASLRNRDLLCFSHDWNGDPLSKTHLMRLLSRHNRVLWVNSIGYRTPNMSRADARRAINKLWAARQPLREVEPNLFVLSPLVIPLHHHPLAQALNRRLLRWQVKQAMRTLEFQRPINWVFNPAAAIVAGELGEDKLIYYCVDEYIAFSGVVSDSLAKLESQLLRRADLALFSSERLCDAKGPAARRSHLIRHGVDYENFRRALDAGLSIPDDVAGLPGPILGYFGLMSSDWIDLDLLVRVAEHFATGSLVLIGKVEMDVSRLAHLPNVHFLGRKPFESLPAYCQAFDVGLIPFPISEVTLNANPLKAREYLAAGLPVVSTAIPEVEYLNQCRTAEDHGQFVREIEAALADPTPRSERSESMREHSWDNRLDDICSHLVPLLDDDCDLIDMSGSQ